MSKYIEQIKVNDEIVRVLEHTDCKDEYIDRVLMAIERIPTIEVSEDCISRDYVRLIESDEDAYYGDWNETYERGFSDAINKVLNAPSAVPSRAEGEWINDTRYSGWTCTNCNYHDGNATDNYCPNCGARMKGQRNDGLARITLHLQDITEELKNIIEILEKQSPRVLLVTRRKDNEPVIVNFDHVACIVEDRAGATIWFDVAKDDRLDINGSVFEL